MDSHNNKIPGGNELLNPKNILEQELGLTYGSKIADLGCGGKGYFTFQSSKLAGDQGLVYAVDILKMLLKNIEHQAKMLGLHNIKTLWSNLEKYGSTSINDSSIDFALLVNVIFQSEHPTKLLREAVRLLKPSAKLLIIDWKEGRFPFGPPADKKIKLEELKDMALGAGLKLIKEFNAGKFHYGLVFEKVS